MLALHYTLAKTGGSYPSGRVTFSPDSVTVVLALLLSPWSSNKRPTRHDKEHLTAQSTDRPATNVPRCLLTVNFGPPQHLNLADVYFLEWVYALTRLLNVLGNAVGDQLADYLQPMNTPTWLTF